jgi:hypothetical protein
MASGSHELHPILYLGQRTRPPRLCVCMTPPACLIRHDACPCAKSWAIVPMSCGYELLPPLLQICSKYVSWLTPLSICRQSFVHRQQSTGRGARRCCSSRHQIGARTRKEEISVDGAHQQDNTTRKRLIEVATSWFTHQKRASIQPRLTKR